ncbi:MAG: hypothetical protein M0Z67_01735 [Nitrospiraceae bacterium]|nr:hypothetical protein [Nitrospiraceae bacterium]
MAKVITYECNQCGCEITVSEGHESHLMPIYCCGVEVSRVSASPKKAGSAKKKPPAAAPRKTAKKAAAKKSAGKATQKKIGPARKKTSKR